MTNNYQLFRKYLFNEGIVESKLESYKSDLFFFIILVKRRKDFPEMINIDYRFKIYYLDNLEDYDKFEKEIKQCCDNFKLRAYLSVNIRSKKEVAKYNLERSVHNLVINRVGKPWDDFFNTCKNIDPVINKRWVIDVDNFTINSKEVEDIISIIKECGASIIEVVPTKTGVHIITTCFNEDLFKKLYKENKITLESIKKNNVTLLYENI